MLLLLLPALPGLALSGTVLLLLLFMRLALPAAAPAADMCRAGNAAREVLPPRAVSARRAVSNRKPPSPQLLLLLLLQSELVLLFLLSVLPVVTGLVAFRVVTGMTLLVVMLLLAFWRAVALLAATLVNAVLCLLLHSSLAKWPRGVQRAASSHIHTHILITPEDHSRIR